METAYLAPTAEATAEVREKGSRFLSIIAPAADEKEAKALVESARRQYSAATHVCWAWRLGMPPRERAADAGEPSGTAGVPMLQVLRGREISDVVAVVARWFGGVKLGKGGLARAYAEVVRFAVDELTLTERAPKTRLHLTLLYERVGGIKRLIHPPEIELVDQTYGEQVRITLSVHESHLPDLEKILADLGVVVVRESG